MKVTFKKLMLALLAILLVGVMTSGCASWSYYPPHQPAQGYDPATKQQTEGRTESHIVGLWPNVRISPAVEVTVRNNLRGTLMDIKHQRRYVKYNLPFGDNYRFIVYGSTAHSQKDSVTVFVKDSVGRSLGSYYKNFSVPKKGIKTKEIDVDRYN